MIEFALVTPDGRVVEIRKYPTKPETFSTSVHSNKSHLLPVVTDDPEYDPVSQVKSKAAFVIEPEQVVRRYTVRAKTPEEITEMRNRKISGIKGEANARILRIMPEHKQRNSLALGMELANTYGSEWPNDMRSEYNKAREAWAAIRQIRERSNKLEASIPSDPHGIDAFDPLAGWD